VQPAFSGFAVGPLEAHNAKETFPPGRPVVQLSIHRPETAAAEFRKILDHKGASWGSTWRYRNWCLYYSISYVGLARGSALAGDTQKARKAYEDFLVLWKDADQDLPILIDTTKQYSALH